MSCSHQTAGLDDLLLLPHSKLGIPGWAAAQRCGDEIFLNFPKWSRIPRVWDLDPRAGVNPRAAAKRRGMRALGTGDTFLFGGFCLDRRGLFRRDERKVFVRPAIGARALDVLCVLVAAGGDLVSKHEMMAAVWPGIV